MNRFSSLVVFVVCLFYSQSMSENYVMLTNASLNIGKEMKNFDINLGIGFNYNQNKSISTGSYSFVDSTLRDTSYSSNNIYTEFLIVPELHIGYYFGNTSVRPFLQLSGYVPIPIYNKIEDYEGKANVNEFSISGSLVCGLDYRIEKVSIGGGIGPSLNYDKSNYTFSQNTNPTYYKTISDQYKNTNLSANMDIQVRIKYYF